MGFLDFFGNIGGGISGGFDKIIDPIKKLIDKVIDALNKIGDAFRALGDNLMEIFALIGCAFEKIGGLFTSWCIIFYIYFIIVNIIYWLFSIIMNIIIGPDLWDALEQIMRELKSIFNEILGVVGISQTLNKMQRNCYCSKPNWTPFPKF